MEHYSLTTTPGAARMAASERVQQVSRHANVAMILYFCVLLGWPDVELANKFIVGFYIIGTVLPLPFYRPAVPKPQTATRETLLAGAEAFVDDLEQSMRPARDAASDRACLELTQKDNIMVLQARFSQGSFSTRSTDAESVDLSNVSLYSKTKSTEALMMALSVSTTTLYMRIAEFIRRQSTYMFASAKVFGYGDIAFTHMLLWTVAPFHWKVASTTKGLRSGSNRHLTRTLASLSLPYGIPFTRGSNIESFMAILLVSRSAC